MADALTGLFNDFDRGKISRRQLFQALGFAAVAAPLATAIGQGSCGANNKGSARCDTTPAKYPFAPTGWKTVCMDHFTVQCVDHEKEAAFFVALMNWKVRSDDGTKVVLDIGDNVGSVVLRGGLVVPPAPPPPPPGDSAAGGRGGRGGRGGGGRGAPHAVWDSMCWGIDPWDAKKVEAELRKRGLNPVADNEGKDFQSFHVKDPDGFDVQISNGNKKNRRQGAANGKLMGPLPFEPTPWKTVWLDHISFAVSNYKQSAAFYEALLGWVPTGDEGSQNELMIGDLGNIIVRGGNELDPNFGGGRGGGGAPARRAVINHISFGMTPFEPDAVKAELDKRGLNGRADTGGQGDIHTWPYKSYHTPTPNGWDIQYSNGTQATRNVR